MNQSVGQEINEDLAQMGIKKGSLIWPILALVVAALVLVVYFQPAGNTPLNDLFKKVCNGVSGKTMDATVQEPFARECFNIQSPEQLNSKSDGFKQFGIVKKWDIIYELYSIKDGPARTDPDVLNSTIWWGLFVDTIKEYTKGLFSKFGEITYGLLKATAFAGFVSLIPGLAGMIYRRNFWGWFLIPFIALFVIASGIIGQKSTEAMLLFFLVSQLLVVLLALRLRRYSRSIGPVPTTVHNWLLAATLSLVAAAWWFGWGGRIWSSWSGWYQWEFILFGLPILYLLLRRSDVWRGREPKNIVMCLDGTTNTPDQFEFGRLAQTNVFKLFKMLKSDARKSVDASSRAFNASLSKRYKDKQIALYYSGVGNRFENDPIVQLLGGATGLGASSVVDRAYLDLMRVYRPGDRILIFGFSRGAAIARLLARAIDQKGAPKTIWTLRLFGRHWTIWRSKRDPRRNKMVPVTVLGCFDTVGAFGIAKNIAGLNFQNIDLFKDLTVPDNVEQAYHMVALDEMREEFEPTLMEPDPIQPARIVEVWFSGDHANIGGGWATTKLSDLTLDFLLKKVSSGYAFDNGMTPGQETWGLYLSAVNSNKVTAKDPDTNGAFVDIDGQKPFVLHPDPLGQLRQWKSTLYVYKPRQLPHHAVISETVFERMANAAPLYAPPSLFNLHDELDKKRKSVNSAVTRLKETDSLTLEEHNAILAFKDKLHLTRWPQYAEFLNSLPTLPRKPEAKLTNEAYADSQV